MSRVTQKEVHIKNYMSRLTFQDSHLTALIPKGVFKRIRLISIN